jgi:uncharacterized Tic20 family protein
VSADEPALATAAAPPGWYPTTYGWQWWDGLQWYPPESQSSGVDDKTLAVLSHLGPLFGGFVLPLVIMLVAKDKPYVRHHSCEALNFAITHLIAQMVAMVIFFFGLGLGGLFSGSGSDASGVGFGLGFGLGGLLFMAVAFGGIVFAIIGAVKASHMEWWRYPVNIRFVKP